ncbi:MAG: chorismate synthase [Acholeplasmatales bacterium]|jgi:chorismate synthase|nr:chorismate synthase [Acholeplasmatales bacterium]
MNTYGNLFKISVYGESHSKYMGVIIDGMKCGIRINGEEISSLLKRRNPSKNYETARKEDDVFTIKSGLLNNYTTGSPICVEIENTAYDSTKYSFFSDVPRPGHIDFVVKKKYGGYADLNGSGMWSGRLSALLVIGGYFASKMIPFITTSEIVNVGGEIDSEKFDSVMENSKKEQDSVGGVIKINTSNMIVGLGEPLFNKLTSNIASLLFSVGGVKGVNFGEFYNDVSIKGSSYNDPFINKEGKTRSNNSGGINAGISSGNDLVIYCLVRPISSISKIQNTYSLKEDKMVDLKIEGRHDSSILNRIKVVLESCVSISLANAYLEYLAYK